MANTKKMSKEDIDSRTKDKSYIALNKDHIAKIITALPADKQVDCFNGEKTIQPIEKFTAAGLLSQIPDLDKIEPKPLSKIPLKRQLEIIKDQSTKNKDFKKLLEDNGFWQRAQYTEEHKEPGDFSPSGLWKVLDEFIKDIDLSKP